MATDRYHLLVGNSARYELLIWVSVARYDLLFGSVLLNIGCNRDWKRLRLNNQPAVTMAYGIRIVVCQHQRWRMLDQSVYNELPFAKVWRVLSLSMKSTRRTKHNNQQPAVTVTYAGRICVRHELAYAKNCRVLSIENTSSLLLVDLAQGQRVTCCCC